jgi:hypothetical protein
MHSLEVIESVSRRARRPAAAVIGGPLWSAHQDALGVALHIERHHAGLISATRGPLCELPGDDVPGRILSAYRADVQQLRSVLRRLESELTRAIENL